MDPQLISSIITAAEHVVFYCSLATLFLAVIEKWANKWFTGSRFANFVSALTDLVSQFGALNFRDKISPRQWDGTDRRGK